jgi:hypothetical protein
MLVQVKNIAAVIENKIGNGNDYSRLVPAVD